MFPEFKCPYCFKPINHNEVHFRSDTVNKTECPYIPADYDDLEDFINRYNGPDKESILQQVQVWEFFRERPDAKYDAFWQKYGGMSTEKDPADDRKGIVPYHRPVINPWNPVDQKYLRLQPDGNLLILDADGFVVGVQDITGNITDRRVCPHCHNPLPVGYGKFPIKFVAVIGITASGKTVFLSQLLRNLLDYAAKVGQDVKLPSQARLFVQENPVKAGVPLPGSTPPLTFLQPLFYEFHQADEWGQIVNNTFVLYDIAGENCKEAAFIKDYGGFIEHADGIILLIDPMQFKTIKGLTDDEDVEAEPQIVLNAIHDVRTGSANEKCDTPLAVCIPKSDMQEVQSLLDPDLRDDLLQAIEGKEDPYTGLNAKEFNSEAYNPIGKRLKQFVKLHEPPLETTLFTRYSCYNYFAFSSLGCDVDEDKKPIGPVIPSRIEEPLLWMWHEFGYIGANPPAIRCGVDRILCPMCGSDARLLKDFERTRTEGFIRKKTIIDTFECNACHFRW